jgi:hypothetical protein
MHLAIAEPATQRLCDRKRYQSCKNQFEFSKDPESPTNPQSCHLSTSDCYLDDVSTSLDLLEREKRTFACRNQIVFLSIVPNDAGETQMRDRS